MPQHYSFPTSSTVTPTSGEEEVMELLWQNSAPVALQQLLLLAFPKSSSPEPGDTASLPPLPPPPSNQLHMAEDEMASWLHYPVEELYGDILYPNPPPTRTPTPLLQLPARCPITLPARGFQVFSMMARSSAPESSMMLSFEKPITRTTDATVGHNAAVMAIASPCPSGSVVVTTTGTATATTGVGEGSGADGGLVSTSSSSATDSANVTAAATATGETGARSVVIDQKRKSSEVEESIVATATPTNTSDPQTEEVELESGDKKKQSRWPSSTKRSRAAEVHNLSERRRRDRINEKMKALQELIPLCNKSDKASMLDDAIEYLKSLQKQVQNQMLSQPGSSKPGPSISEGDNEEDIE